MSYVSIRKPINDRIVQASCATENEIIGLLLGKLENDTVIIEEEVTGEFSAEPTRVRLQPSTLAKIADDILAGRIKGNIIGWYHSHTSGGLFFSETDVETQKTLQQFSRLTIGMVVDTQTGQVGYFRVDQEGRPFRVPDDRVTIYTHRADAAPLRQPTKQSRFALTSTLLTPKAIIAVILIALIASIALFGVLVYRTAAPAAAAPTVTLTPIMTANVGQPVLITANTTGVIQNVKLYYEPAGMPSFTSVVMNSPVAGEYQYLIPGYQVSGNLTYYIRASDTNGAEALTDIYNIHVADFRPVATNETLTVYRNSTKPTISQLLMESINGFSQQVAISAHAPAGINVNLPTKAPVGTPVQMRITANPNTSTGTFQVVIASTYSPSESSPITHEATIQVTVTDFTIQLNPNSEAVFPGTQAIYNLTFIVQSGFTAPIKVTTLNLPPGARTQVLSGGIVLNGAGAATETLQISTSTTTKPGTYTVTVTATATLDTGDYIAHSQTIQLTVR